MTRYNLTPSESQKNPCAICGKPATFVVIRKSGNVTFGCRKCFH